MIWRRLLQPCQTHPLWGRREALTAIQRYRSKGVHRDPGAQTRLSDRGFAANRVLQTAAKSQPAKSVPTEKPKKQSMNILFIHQNFPGQFKHLAPALAQRGHRVIALTMQKVKDTQWQGVELVPYAVSQGSTPAPTLGWWILRPRSSAPRGRFGPALRSRIRALSRMPLSRIRGGAKACF